MDKTPTKKPAKEVGAEVKAPVPKVRTMVEALIEFQKTVPAIRKDKKGNYGEYSSLDELMGKARPVLNALGFALTQDVYTAEDGANWIQTVLTYVTGEKMESRPLKLRDEGVGMQKLGSSITYARRYQGGTFLGLTTDEDNDAQVAQDASEKAESQGMLADKNARVQYVNFIRAVAQKLGTNVPDDLDGLSTPDLIKVAQESKQMLQAAQAEAGNGGA